MPGPPASAGAAALLLLGDGRFPAGGYAHSAGLEPLTASGRVSDVATFEQFLHGRVTTVGAVAAAFAAAACGAVKDGDLARLTDLDRELDARMPSPAQRSTSRQLGRQLVRTVGLVRPDARLERLGTRPHHPVVLGAAADVFGLGRRDAALLALHEAAAGPTAAVVRLLPLDPFSAHAALARLGPCLDALADAAVTASLGDPSDLPAAGSPLLDLAAEDHARRAMRLFAS
jgi:urease accessory protein